MSARPLGLLALFALSCTGEATAPTPEPSPPPKAPAATDYAPEAQHDRRFELRQIPSASGDPEAPMGPLPEQVAVSDAVLNLTVDPRLDSFGGSATYFFELLEPTDVIWMHGQGLDVTEVLLEDPTQGLVPVSWTPAADPGVARVDLGQVFAAGEYSMQIAYAAPFDTNLSGLFKVEEHGHPYALAKSESIQARKYLPGFDEPRFKPTWEVRLTVPTGMTAIANSPVDHKLPTAGGELTQWNFEKTPPLPTYLLSLSVGPFEERTGPEIAATELRPQALQVRGYARPGKAEELDRILGLTPGLLAFYEDALGLPYPYDKLDIVAAPAWPSGATELSGAITYRESRILLGPDPSPATRRSMEGVHAHELTHMWFGNMVTPPWWEDLWLKEGFATWGTTAAWSQLDPDGGWELDALEGTLGAMGGDHLASSRAVKEPIERNADIRNAYDGITYSKGRAVITMMDAFFGAETFRPALGRYLADHRDGTADADQFYAAMAKHTGEQALVDSLRSFVEQPGVPLLTVELSCEEGGNNEIRVSQQAYAPVGGRAPSDRLWTVPLCLDVDGERQCSLMTEASATFPLEGGACPTRVHPNPGGTAYVRFALQDDQWQAFAEALPELPAADALVLVASAQAQFSAGTLDAAVLRSIFEAAARHPERRVATRPLGTVASWSQHYVDDAARTELRAWADATWRPRLEQSAAGTDDDAVQLQSSLLSFFAKDLEDPATRQELSDAAARWAGFQVEAEPSALMADRYTLALTVAVQDLGEPFVRHLLELRTTRDDPRLGLASAAALGRVRDPALAAELRALVLTGELDPREAFSMVDGLMSEEQTREDTWTWLLAELGPFSEVIPSQWRRRVPRLLRASCNPSWAGTLEATIEGEEPVDLPGHERGLAQVTEQLGLCRAARTELGPGVQELFRP